MTVRDIQFRFASSHSPVVQLTGLVQIEDTKKPAQQEALLVGWGGVLFLYGFKRLAEVSVSCRWRRCGSNNATTALDCQLRINVAIVVY